MCEHEGKCLCYGKMGRLLIPSILLLLAENSSYGYELAGRYKELGLTNADIDMGAIYRTLKHLEEEGFVKYKWKTKGKGPAKKIYYITPAGKELLANWAGEIRYRKEVLSRFLKRVESLQ